MFDLFTALALSAAGWAGTGLLADDGDERRPEPSRRAAPKDDDGDRDRADDKRPDAKRPDANRPQTPGRPGFGGPSFGKPGFGRPGFGGFGFGGPRPPFGGPDKKPDAKGDDDDRKPDAHRGPPMHRRPGGDDHADRRHDDDDDDDRRRPDPRRPGHRDDDDDDDDDRRGHGDRPAFRPPFPMHHHFGMHRGPGPRPGGDRSGDHDRRPAPDGDHRQGPPSSPRGHAGPQQGDDVSRKLDRLIEAVEGLRRDLKK